jgi:hypothetical protein
MRFFWPRLIPKQQMATAAQTSAAAEELLNSVRQQTLQAQNLQQHPWFELEKLWHEPRCAAWPSLQTTADSF